VIKSALHVRGYDAATGTATEVSPVLCPEGMVHQLAVEPYSYVGPLSGQGEELCAVVRYFGETYAVAADDDEFDNRRRWLTLAEAARMAGIGEATMAKVIGHVPGARRVEGVRGDWRVKAAALGEWKETLSPADWKWLRDGGAK